jgi:hypothetical protein
MKKKGKYRCRFNSSFVFSEGTVSSDFLGEGLLELISLSGALVHQKFKSI